MPVLSRLRLPVAGAAAVYREVFTSGRNGFAHWSLTASRASAVDDNRRPSSSMTSNFTAMNARQPPSCVRTPTGTPWNSTTCFITEFSKREGVYNKSKRFGVSFIPEMSALRIDRQGRENWKHCPSSKAPARAASRMEGTAHVGFVNQNVLNSRKLFQ